MTETVPIEPAFERIRGFRWGQVPPVPVRVLDRAAQPEPDLGAIAGFTGTSRAPASMPFLDHKTLLLRRHRYPIILTGPMTIFSS